MDNLCSFICVMLVVMGGSDHFLRTMCACAHTHTQLNVHPKWLSNSHGPVDTCVYCIYITSFHLPIWYSAAAGLAIPARIVTLVTFLTEIVNPVSWMDCLPS